MLDIVIGKRKNHMAAEQLVSNLRDFDIEGTLYVGYPIIASADGAVYIDALLTSQHHGVVAFHFFEGTNDGIASLLDTQDDLYAALHQRFFTIRELRKGRSLSFEVQVVSITPEGFEDGLPDNVLAVRPSDLKTTISGFPSINFEQLKSVNAAIQHVSTIKPLNKRSSVQKLDSRGAVIKKIEKEIANLDSWQKRAAIETPEGPQRIRGLAGSGKTVVLALKAAFLHASNPTWDIAVTFNTRSLYQQFKDLIRRFSFEYIKDEPDWSKLRIIHAWGGVSQDGIYYLASLNNDLAPQTYAQARKKYSMFKAFEGVCDELIEALRNKSVQPLFDALLIDEAQDLPKSFFELSYLLTKEPNRIVYAYDELQNLNEYTIAPPTELFGKNADGTVRVPNLENEDAQPSKDIVLPICYRNTKWALTTAHSLGFGTSRQDGLVQFFDDPSLLKDIGYREVAGELRKGQRVTIERKPDAHPDYFLDLVQPEDALICKVFANPNEQADWVAAEINKNIVEDELELKDILVILAEPTSARSEAARLISALSNYEIPAHLAGVTADVDMLFDEHSIAMSSIYRAKGNEAPMIYVLNSQYGYAGVELIKRRNILFTAITRSRAWVRICGWGEAMTALSEEIHSVVSGQYKLDFKVPTDAELEAMRRVHRDRTQGEKTQLKIDLEAVKRVYEQYKEGDLSLETLDPEMKEALGFFTNVLSDEPK